MRCLCPSRSGVRVFFQAGMRVRGTNAKFLRPRMSRWKVGGRRPEICTGLRPWGRNDCSVAVSCRGSRVGAAARDSTRAARLDPLDAARYHLVTPTMRYRSRPSYTATRLNVASFGVYCLGWLGVRGFHLKPMITRSMRAKVDHPSSHSQSVSH